MEPLRTTKQWNNNIAGNFCKNPFAKYPFFQLLILKSPKSRGKTDFAKGITSATCYFCIELSLLCGGCFLVGGRHYLWKTILGCHSVSSLGFSSISSAWP